MNTLCCVCGLGHSDRLEVFQLEDLAFRNEGGQCSELNCIHLNLFAGVLGSSTYRSRMNRLCLKRRLHAHVCVNACLSVVPIPEYVEIREHSSGDVHFFSETPH